MGAVLAAAPAVLTVRWAVESPATTAAAAPSVAARRSLAEWAAARGVRLADPGDGVTTTIPLDLTVGDAVEEQLDRARDAITAQDAAGADAALATAEALVEAHPELPQAAWLLAEVLRARGVRWRRLPPHGAASEQESAKAWARAAALDGGRSEGVGEIEGRVASPGASAPATVSVEGLAAGEAAEVRLDGVPLDRRRPANDAGGVHQVTVTRGRDGALVWAGWVTLDQDAHAHVVLPHAAACSADDLATARITTDAISAHGVLCPEWVFVRAIPGEVADGALSIAWCAGDRCGPALRWTVGPMGPVLPERRARAAWPAWATWTILGASAVAVTVGTLAAAGVFRPTHEEPVFTTGGLRVTSERGAAP